MDNHIRSHLAQVDELRREPDPRTYKTLLVHIMAEHIGDSAPSEVNLSDESRRKMEERVMIVNDALDKVGWFTRVLVLLRVYLFVAFAFGCQLCSMYIPGIL